DESSGDEAAQCTLGHGPQCEERLGRNQLGTSLLLDGEVAHLRAVSVNHHDPPSIGDEGVYGAGHRQRVGVLLLHGSLLIFPAEGVAPEGEYGRSVQSFLRNPRMLASWR